MVVKAVVEKIAVLSGNCRSENRNISSCIEGFLYIVKVVQFFDQKRDLFAGSEAAEFFKVLSNLT